MSGYEYVARDERMHIKRFVIQSLNFTQNCVKEKYTYRYHFVGNEPRCIITRNLAKGIGDQYDIQIVVNDDEEYFTAKGICNIFLSAFSLFCPKYDIIICTDNEYIIKATIKNKRVDNLLLTVNIALTKEIKGKTFILKYKDDLYYWEEKELISNEIMIKEKWCKELNYWNELRESFLLERNKEENFDVESRVLYEKVLNDLYKTKG